MTFNSAGQILPSTLPPPTLRTARLLLRLPRESDRRQFIHVQEVSRELHRPWLPSNSPEMTSDEFFDRQRERAQAGWEAGNHLRLVGELGDGRLVGMFNLNEIVRGCFHNAFAGWRVSAEFARQGYGTEAVNGLLDLAFAPVPDGLGLHRVQANVIPDNEASLKLAAKCGFRREGLALRYLNIAGRWQDHVMLAKLNDEHVRKYL